MLDLPALLPNGNLPPGVHLTTIENVINRFGSSISPKRVELGKNLRLLWDFFHPYISQMYIDGSFTTSKITPGDVDILLVFKQSFRMDNKAISQFVIFQGLNRKSLHLFHMEEGTIDPKTHNIFITFTHDRDGSEKGIVVLEN